MKKIIIFGEALTYPPKEGICAHLFSTLYELSKSPSVNPVLVMSDRGFFDIEVLDNLPWPTVIVPADIFYDEEEMFKLVSELNPDIIQSYNVYQARIVGIPLAQRMGVPFVFEHHDLETELSSFLGLPKKLAEENRHYQDDIFRYASINRIMSHHDYEYLRTTYANEPNVINTLKWLPVSQANTTGSLKPRPNRRGVLFIGNCSYPPNSQAVDYILKNLAPCNPELDFHIIGRNSDELCSKVNLNNVYGHGAVDDMNSIISMCFVGIIPISAGSGMKVKILSYISAGLPVLGTDIAFNGYPESEVLFVADTATSYNEQLNYIFKETDQNAISVKAMQYYKNNFDPEMISDKLIGLYQNLPDRILTADRPKLATISRNDQRLAWIHELREKPYDPVKQLATRGFVI